MAKKGPPQIGDIVEIYCSKCRLNLDASVAAIVGGEVVKVTCRTCDNEVPMKPPMDMGAKKEKQLERLMKMRQKRLSGPAVPAPTPDAVRALWDELTGKVDTRRAKVYDKHRRYKVEEILLHKEHGMGVVHDVEADGELNVLFRHGFERLPSDVPVDED